MLESHNHRGGGVPQQGAGEDHAPPEPIRRESEEHGTDEQPGESGGDKTGEAVKSEERRRGTGEQPASHQARPNISGKEEIVDFKASAQGKQQYQLPDVSRSGKPVEPGADLGSDGRVTKLCQRYPFSPMVKYRRS